MTARISLILGKTRGHRRRLQSPRPFILGDNRTGLVGLLYFSPVTARIVQKSLARCASSRYSYGIMQCPLMPQSVLHELRMMNMRLLLSYPTAATQCPPTTFSPGDGIGTMPVSATSWPSKLSYTVK